MKKFVLSLFLILSVFLSCDQIETELKLDEVCYKCYTFTIKDYCTYTENTVITDSLKCDWTSEEILQYEEKGTYTLIEKCFTLTQMCKCFIEE
jgi:hypothetical protein